MDSQADVDSNPGSIEQTAGHGSSGVAVGDGAVVEKEAEEVFVVGVDAEHAAEGSRATGPLRMSCGKGTVDRSDEGGGVQVQVGPCSAVKVGARAVEAQLRPWQSSLVGMLKAELKDLVACSFGGESRARVLDAISNSSAW